VGRAGHTHQDAGLDRDHVRGRVGFEDGGGGDRAAAGGAGAPRPGRRREPLPAVLESAREPATRGHPVTLRLLLSHRSGLPSTNFPYDDNTSPTLVQVLQGTPPAQNAPAVLQSVPGSAWRYSNLGYVLVQLVLEDATGKPLQ